MWGVNLYTGGHFDLYVADYYDYKVTHYPACVVIRPGRLLFNCLKVCEGSGASNG